MSLLRFLPVLGFAALVAACAFLFGQLKEEARQHGETKAKLEQANAETQKANAAIASSDARRIEEANRAVEIIAQERARLDAIQQAITQANAQSAALRRDVNTLRRSDEDLDRILASILSDDFLRFHCQAARDRGARPAGECDNLLPPGEPAGEGPIRP